MIFGDEIWASSGGMDGLRIMEAAERKSNEVKVKY